MTVLRFARLRPNQSTIAAVIALAGYLALMWAGADLLGGIVWKVGLGLLCFAGLGLKPAFLVFWKGAVTLQRAAERIRKAA